MKRKIIKIDEEKCNGCGKCVGICAEAALEIIDGKAKVVNDFLCDGMGACLDVCPVGALEIVEKDADRYDSEKAYSRVKDLRGEKAAKNVHGFKKEPAACSMGKSCPGTMPKNIFHDKDNASSLVDIQPELHNWPLQLRLMNPDAPYLENADLIVSADCAPFAYPNFHQKLLKGKILTILCPKLDDVRKDYIEKLAYIFENRNIRLITIVHMEVPCCSGIEHMVSEAIKKSQKNIDIKKYCISLGGEIVK
ncbi:4Fe-4S binding protein [Candidatus Parcubacteria bacterium]|nr:4Fe-4S binding protein [Candidatus Parcubacteria bacterium]